jgi:hypothetical protein
MWCPVRRKNTLSDVAVIIVSARSSAHPSPFDDGASGDVDTKPE